MSDFSTRRPERRELSTDTLLVLLAACVLAVACAAAVREWRWLARARESTEQTRRVLEDTRARARTLQDEKVSDEQARLAAQAVLNVEAPPAAVLAALERTLPADVRLERLELTYGLDVDIDMQVEARRPAAYDEFLTQITRSPHFRAVLPGSESRGDLLRATVKARYRTGAP
jgi:hypothetical protein